MPFFEAYNCPNCDHLILRSSHPGAPYARGAAGAEFYAIACSRKPGPSLFDDCVEECGHVFLYERTHSCAAHIRFAAGALPPLTLTIPFVCSEAACRTTVTVITVNFREGVKALLSCAAGWKLHFGCPNGHSLELDLATARNRIAEAFVQRRRTLKSLKAQQKQARRSYARLSPDQVERVLRNVSALQLLDKPLASKLKQ